MIENILLISNDLYIVGDDLILDQWNAVYFVESSVDIANKSVSRGSYLILLLLADFSKGVSLGQGFELPGFIDSCIDIPICRVESFNSLVTTRAWHVADAV